jgi:membrane protease YdiL (CAAX protease family)
MSGYNRINIYSFFHKNKIYEELNRIMKKISFISASVVLIIWAVITLGGEMLSAGGKTTGLEELTSSQVVPALVVAPIFLFIIVAFTKTWRVVGLKGLVSAHSLWLIWVPALIIIILLVFGLPNNTLGSKVIITMLINSLLVGISEELMFRGILLEGTKNRYSLWASIWIVSLLFGAIHSLNGFLTGNFGAAIIQAVNAIALGLMFVGLRLRQDSLFPAMLIHGLWDFSLFVVSGSTLPIVVSVMTPFFPIICVVYGLWLVKDYRHKQSNQKTA